LPRAKLESLGGGRFRVSGVLDATTAGDLLKESEGRFSNEPRLQIDMTGVSDSDSAGLALLIEWLRMAKDAKAELQFSNVPGQVSALARISEVEDLLISNTANAASTAA
jgi:phospholipid transport system transporter-binding protein